MLGFFHTQSLLSSLSSKDKHLRHNFEELAVDVHILTWVNALAPPTYSADATNSVLLLSPFLGNHFKHRLPRSHSYFLLIHIDMMQHYKARPAGAVAPSTVSSPPPAAAAIASVSSGLKSMASSEPHLSTFLPVETNGRKRKSARNEVKEGADPRLMSVDEDEADPGPSWTEEQDAKLRKVVASRGPKNWKKISQEHFHGLYTDTQCLNRWYKVLRPGLVKGPWLEEEDTVILQCMRSGLTKWSEIAERIPGRLGKQCRERWLNHLDPSVSKSAWSIEEDRALLAGQARHGNAWAKIADLLPGRSENSVKNRWNSAAMARLRGSVDRSPPPDRDEDLERQTVREYCLRMAEALGTSEPQEGMARAAGAWHPASDSSIRKVSIKLADFIPSVMGALESANPGLYGGLGSAHIKPLHARLRVMLEREAEKYGPAHALYRSVLRRAKKKSAATTLGPKLNPTQTPTPAPAAAMPKLWSCVPGTATLPAAAPAACPEKLFLENAPQAFRKRTRKDDQGAAGALGRGSPLDVSSAVPLLHQLRMEPSPQTCHVPAQGKEPSDKASSKHHRSHEEPSMSSISPVNYEASQEGPTQRRESPPFKRDESFLSIPSNPMPRGSDALAYMTSSSLCSSAGTPSPSIEDAYSGLKSLALAVSSLSGLTSMSAPKHNDIRPDFTPGYTTHKREERTHEQHVLSRGARLPAEAVATPSPSQSQGMRDVISLLFAALRRETDASRRTLLQDALDAATQEIPSMVNLVEGGLGSNAGIFSLARESDRIFMLNQLMTAAHRGVFRPCNRR